MTDKTPTIKQKQAFNKALSNIAKGEHKSWNKTMQEVGYSEATAKNPTKNLLNKPAFKELLNKVHDDDLLRKLRDIALDDNDKRASISAIDMLLKLKDRYPAGKLKMQEYQDEIGSVSE